MNGSAEKLTPYKGLVPYSIEDAPFFFGREAEREIITANLMASRLTLLYGASGVGKSSVLNAGVAHNLRSATRESLQEYNSPEFVVAVFNSWRDDPVAGLANRIHKCLAQSVKDQEVESVSPEGSLAEMIEAWTGRINTELFIILDQFEEYFLYHAQEDGRGTFIYEFPRAVNRCDLRANFIISIREDALAKLDRFKGRIPNLFDNYLRVDHLDREAARNAIVKPLEEYNRRQTSDGEKYSIEPELVETVLEQVRTGEVVLGEAGRGAVGGNNSPEEIETPYLQQVLMHLWKEENRSGSRRLRLETLKRLGGAENIVRMHLDETMSSLKPEEQEVAAQVFRYLVTPSRTKIAYIVPDLSNLTGLKQADLSKVLETLSSQSVRILRPVAPPPNLQGEQSYEIFHDVLASSILDWRARYTKEREKADTEKQLARERKRVLRLRLGLAGLFLLFIIMLSLALLAHYLQISSEAAKLAASAISNLGIDPDDSLKLANDAALTTGTIENEAEYALRKSLIESHLRAVLEGHKYDVSRATFSPDGSYIVTVSKPPSESIDSAESKDPYAQIWKPGEESNTWQRVGDELKGHKNEITGIVFSPDNNFVVTAGDSTPRVWKLSTGELIGELKGHTAPVSTIAFSRDGRFIVTGSADKTPEERDNTAHVWDAQTGASLFELKGHSKPLTCVAISPDSKTVITSSEDNKELVWNIETGAKITTLPLKAGVKKEPVEDIFYSPNGMYVVLVSSDSKTPPRVLDASNWKEVSELRGHKDNITSAMFNQNETLIVTASRDRTARVWNVRTGASEAVLSEHTDWVNSAAFSPDGRLVVTASDDGTAIVSETQTMHPRLVLRGHKDAINYSMFSPDGGMVVTASRDKTAQLWDVSAAQSSASWEPHADFISSVTFSPDGKYILTASHDDTAQLWDAESRQKVYEIKGHDDDITCAAFSSDGKLIVTASRDKTAIVWEKDNNGAWTKKGKLVGHSSYVNSAAFGPDGNLIVTASEDATAKVWNTSTGAIVASLPGENNPFTSAAFSPDGKMIVTASADKTARIWDTSNWQEVAKLSGHSGPVNTAFFSPDGKMVVTASEDRTARVWHVGKQQKIPVMRGHSRGVRYAAFSPDGRLVVTASRDGTVSLWQAATGRNLTVFRGHIADATCAAFSSDGETIVTASKDNILQLYRCEACVDIKELLGRANTRLQITSKKPRQD